MQGPAFKVTVFMVATLVSALTFATNNNNSRQKTETKTATFNSGAGCMACHRGEVEPLSKKQAD